MYRPLLIGAVFLVGIGAGFGIALLVSNGESANPVNLDAGTSSTERAEPVQAEEVASVSQESGAPPKQEPPIENEEVEACEDCAAEPHYGPHVHQWRILLLGAHLYGAVRMVELESGCFVETLGSPSPLFSETFMALAAVEMAVTVSLLAQQAEMLKPSNTDELAHSWPVEIERLAIWVGELIASIERSSQVDCNTQLSGHLESIFGSSSRRRDVPKPWLWTPFHEMKPVLYSVALNRITFALNGAMRFNCWGSATVDETEVAYSARMPQMVMAVFDWIDDEQSYLAVRIRRQVAAWRDTIHDSLIAHGTAIACPYDLERLVATEYVTASYFGEFTGAADRGAFDSLIDLLPFQIMLETIAQVYGCGRGQADTSVATTVTESLRDLARYRLLRVLYWAPGVQPKYELTDDYSVVRRELRNLSGRVDSLGIDDVDDPYCFVRELDLIDDFLVKAGEKLVDVPRP